MKKLHMLVMLLALLALVSLAGLSVAAPVHAGTVQATTPTTCANEDYAYTKLRWCQKICESNLSQAEKDVYIHRWMGRYRDLPYCLLD